MAEKAELRFPNQAVMEVFVPNINGCFFKRRLFRIAGMFVLAGMFHLPGFGQSGEASSLPDGLYRVIQQEGGQDSGTDAVIQVVYNRLFHEGDIGPETRLWVDTSDYVPLILDIPPRAEIQEGEKKRLLLSLTPAASEKLKTFSTRHLDQRVAILMDGEVVSAHRVRTPLTSGMLQISWCGPDACEVLQARLVRNVAE